MKVRNKTNGQFIKDEGLNRTKECSVCGKEFYCRSQFKYETGKYCSSKCQSKSYSKMKKGKAPYKMTEEIKQSISNSKKGIPIWGGKRNVTWLSGENNFNWKGGITPINEKLRKTVEYEEWRKSIFTRDNYTCQLCGTVGGILHADHIKPFAYFEELRLDTNNGRTLCVSCHRNTETWGFKGIKRYERRDVLRA